jgi:hypothetical protein
MGKSGNKLGFIGEFPIEIGNTRQTVMSQTFTVIKRAAESEKF